jgi:hypothetical protein
MDLDAVRTFVVAADAGQFQERRTGTSERNGLPTFGAIADRTVTISRKPSRA